MVAPLTTRTTGDRPDFNSCPYDHTVVVLIEESIDLHHFSPGDIRSVVEEYLEQCRQAGIRKARLIHGRGKGVQRQVVRSVLAKHPLVASFQDAPPESGGWGSTAVVLRESAFQGTAGKPMR